MCRGLTFLVRTGVGRISICVRKKNEETRELTPLTFVFDDVGNTLYPRHCLLLEKDT